MVLYVLEFKMTHQLGKLSGAFHNSTSETTSLHVAEFARIRVFTTNVHPNSGEFGYVRRATDEHRYSFF